jgi:ArsR family metal-binding transcriptional regulator
MSTKTTELDLIQQKQNKFQELVDECNHSELGQCAKLLAMHIAMYKQFYGDIPVDSIMQISEASTVNQELSQIIQEGIEEASTMLRLVRDEQRMDQRSFYYYPTNNMIN